ncbi:MAG: precorrin-6Y C5,15-methyltransferase (decarboxylating) subunit CbiT [Candidatus Hodarchaeota archaeon]
MEKRFMKVKGGPTKEEILAIALYKLDLRDGDIFLDVGCGTGSVSIAAAKVASKIFAIDRRKEAIEASKFNFRLAGISHKIELIHGETPQVLEKVGEIDSVFIGGSENLEETLTVLESKVRRRIVVNAARLETVITAIKKMRELGNFKEVVHVQVSKGYELQGGMAFKPENPVFIIVGGKEGD